ncbi:MAG TPA: hypothetical protein PLK99_11000, partial [Burkholderiales bacterium]|nr:hypothetical protein [Burkholderiales bacterium]
PVGRPARQSDAEPAGADVLNDERATPVIRLSDRLAARKGDDAPACAALEALSMSLQELKARATSVSVHLPEHQDLIEQIKNL